MSEFIAFVILGLSTGALYGLSGLGVVLIYKGSRVVNFAQGAIALLAAVVFHEMTAAGLPAAMAVVGALLAACTSGLVLDLAISWWMRAASSTSKLIASIAFLLVVQAWVALHYGGVTQFVSPILPTTRLSVFGVTVGADRLLLIVIGLGLAAALSIAYRRTRFGLATVAAAANPLAAASLGHSPRLLARANWVIGSLLAGITGVLIVPIVGITSTSFSQLLFPALGAALIADFKRFDVTIAMSLVLGVAESLATRYIEATGWSSAIPFLVVLVVLLLKSASRGREEATEAQPPVGSGFTDRWLTIATLAGTAIVLTAVTDADWLNAIIITLIFGLLGLSVVVVTGFSGQISFAQFTFAGVGALIAARASHDFSLPFVMCLLAGTAAAALVGLLFAIPTLRARGAALAIVTLGLALSFEAVVFGNTSVNGGFGGISVKPPTIAGLSLDPSVSPFRYSLLVLVITAVVFFAVARLRRGAGGRFLLAARDSQRAAASMGISVPTVRLAAFTISAAIAGLAGGLLAFTTPNVFLTGYTFDASVALLVAAVLGGVGYISGAVASALGATGGVTWWALNYTGQQQYLPLAIGLFTFVQIVCVPGGLAQINGAMASKLRRLLHIKPVVVPQPRIDTTGESAERSHGDHALVVDAVSVAFGGVQALIDVSLEVRSGEIVGLIGPNGAGKTTLIDTVTGSNRRYTGSVSLDGEDLAALRPHQRARRGLGRSFQALELVDVMSVGENLCVAGEAVRLRGVGRDLVRSRTAKIGGVASRTVRAFHLDQVVNQRPGDLSHGRRRLVSVARALAGSPRIVMLDEPAAGLDQQERAEFSRLVKALVDRTNVGVLLVEHDVAMVFAVCDRVYALVEGQVLVSGPPAQVREDPRVVGAFLGHAEEDPSAQLLPDDASPERSVDSTTRTPA